MKVDIERLKKSRISVVGICNTPERLALIEEAIKAIGEKQNPWKTHYWGIKNYAHFGDQRENHEYGFGPKHGSIVFEISPKTVDHRSCSEFGENEIYYLLVARSYKGLRVPNSDSRSYQMLGMGAALKRVDSLAESLSEAIKTFDDLDVST